MKLRTVLAAGMSLFALTGFFFATTTTQAQDGTTTPKAGAGKRTGGARRANPLTAAIAAVDLTTEQKDKLKEIMKKSRDERQAAMPTAGAGTTGNRQTPEMRAKIAEIEAKQVAEVKAILTAEQQPKFQAAYDAAKSERDSMGVFQQVVTKLALTEEQETKVKPILAEAGQSIMKIRQDDSIKRRDKATQTADVWKTTKEKIRPILTTEQQKTLDEIQDLRGPGAGRRGGAGKKAGAK